MEISLWATGAVILFAALVAAFVARPTYTGRHRAPGPPRYGNDPGAWREFLRGNPGQESMDWPLNRKD